MVWGLFLLDENYGPVMPEAVEKRVRGPARCASQA
jgi:hypothetical protein